VFIYCRAVKKFVSFIDPMAELLPVFKHCFRFLPTDFCSYSKPFKYPFITGYPTHWRSSFCL